MTELAYLVIREGSKWTDVFRLVPGQSVIIGRAPTNQIVLQDERCSRAHAELFLSEGQWTLRDLESRNGTAVGETLVSGDWVLSPGDVIRIGRSQLVYVHNLGEAFSETGTVLHQEIEERTEPADLEEDSSVLAAYEPTTITHRRGQTRFLESTGQVEKEDETAISRMGRAAAQLCRLAFELGKAPDTTTLAELTLGGLFEAAQVDAGALLLLPRDFQGTPSGLDLEVVASETRSQWRYHRVSDFLATTVMRELEAVLARNVMGDSTLGSRDSKGEIHATSVICAPVRRGEKVLGLIHLYSTDPERVPDPDDLEFTLAVAETVAVALTNLHRRQ